jgi:hypothetical protein
MRRPYPTKLSPYGPGSGVFHHLRGHLFMGRPYHTILCGNYLLIVVIFCEESSAKY